ncbi:MAG: InlB B-repeat-containing protein, partial [Ignavibacteriae bacterium]|nr:InlB B-repeat-containing protein [Ignavibacteriota bacterium]
MNKFLIIVMMLVVVTSITYAGGATINATASTGGTISPSGTVSIPTPADQIFVITADAGYHIDSVVVDGVKTDSTGSYTFYSVVTDHTIDAYFSINSYILTYNAGSNGSITGTTPQTVNHGSDGSAVTAVADTGYHFVDWSDASTDNPRTDMNVQSDITVTANFAINTYTLTYNAGSNGSITG